MCVQQKQAQGLAGASKYGYRAFQNTCRRPLGKGKHLHESYFVGQSIDFSRYGFHLRCRKFEKVTVESLVVNGKTWNLGGYLNVEIVCTMKDLMVNFAEAAFFFHRDYLSETGRQGQACVFTNPTGK